MIDWLVLAVAGKVLIYLWQEFPLPSQLKKFAFIDKLHVCDLCAGVHIYAMVSWVTGLHFFGYMPVASEYLTGGIVSFIVHIFSIGWTTRFSSEIIIS